MDEDLADDGPRTVEGPRGPADSLEALFDPLTELPGPALFRDRLEQAISLARRRRALVGVLVLGLTGLARHVESLGAEAGDFLRREAALRLRETLRESDSLARLEDDRFAVVLPLIEDSGSAREAARRLLASLARPIHLGGEELDLAPFAGGALYPLDGAGPSQLIDDADFALAWARRSARRDVVLFEDTPGVSDGRWAV